MVKGVAPLHTGINERTADNHARFGSASAHLVARCPGRLHLPLRLAVVFLTPALFALVSRLSRCACGGPRCPLAAWLGA